MKRIVSLLLTLTVLICALFSGADVVRSETKDPYKESEKLLTVFQYDDKEPTLTREEFIKAHYLASRMQWPCMRTDKNGVYYSLMRLSGIYDEEKNAEWDQKTSRYIYKPIPAEEFEEKIGELIVLNDDNLAKLRTLCKYDATNKTYTPVSGPGMGEPLPTPYEGYIDLGNNLYEFYIPVEARQNIYDKTSDNKASFLVSFNQQFNRVIYEGYEYWSDQSVYESVGFSRLLGYKAKGVCITIEFKDDKARYVSHRTYIGHPESYTRLPER